jgi:hypothetical protein
VPDGRSATGTRGERPPAILPRLMNIREAASYLAVSSWTVRDYVLQGLIPIVTMPGLRPKAGDQGKQTLRRVLIDREDLDAFVCSRKRNPF